MADYDFICFFRPYIWPIIMPVETEVAFLECFFWFYIIKLFFTVETEFLEFIILGEATKLSGFLLPPPVEDKVGWP